MTAIQENERLSFGSARLFGVDASGNSLYYAQLNDIQVDFKTDLKEAYGENSYPFAVADGHRSIDISAKHYLLDAFALSASIGGGAPDPTNTTGYVVDEKGTIDESAHTYTLAQATPILPLLSVVVGVVISGKTVPVYYKQVDSSPAAGVSYTYSGGVLTFASGDDGLGITVTYGYTAGSALGASIAVEGGFQNSQPFMSLTCLRRDASRIDGSTGYIAFEFLRVRDAGIKMPYKEGDYTVYERTFKAFADPMGNVCNIQLFNS